MTFEFGIREKEVGKGSLLVLSKRQKEMSQDQPFSLECYIGTEIKYSFALIFLYDYIIFMKPVRIGGCLRARLRYLVISLFMNWHFLLTLSGVAF